MLGKIHVGPAREAKTVHDRLRSVIVWRGVAQHTGEPDAVKGVMQCKLSCAKGNALAPEGPVQTPANLIMWAKRMILFRVMHHAHIAREAIAFKDSKSPIAEASPGIDVGFELGLSLARIDRPAEIIHDIRIGV